MTESELASEQARELVTKHWPIAKSSNREVLIREFTRALLARSPDPVKPKTAGELAAEQLVTTYCECNVDKFAFVGCTHRLISPAPPSPENAHRLADVRRAVARAIDASALRAAKAMQTACLHIAQRQVSKNTIAGIEAIDATAIATTAEEAK